jgi:2-haloacid dehalogenase
LLAKFTAGRVPLWGCSDKNFFPTARLTPLLEADHDPGHSYEGLSNFSRGWARRMPIAYDAVLFDLLTALLDSWSLWDLVASDAPKGREWRAAYLRRTYATGSYRPYEELVAEAALEVGLPSEVAGELARRYGELRPWPEAQEVLAALSRRVPVGIVTNCSDALAARAVRCVGTGFAVVVSAERAGFYKPDPHPYRLALDEMGVAAHRCLFVAGSPYDLVGTARVGLPAFWHNRIGLRAPPEAPKPIAEARSLSPLVEFVLRA